jgi:hypothetical protein
MLKSYSINISPFERFNAFDWYDFDYNDKLINSTDTPLIYKCDYFSIVIHLSKLNNYILSVYPNHPYSDIKYEKRYKNLYYTINKGKKIINSCKELEDIEDTINYLDDFFNV